MARTHHLEAYLVKGDIRIADMTNVDIYTGKQIDQVGDGDDVNQILQIKKTNMFKEILVIDCYLINKTDYANEFEQVDWHDVEFWFPEFTVKGRFYFRRYNVMENYACFVSGDFEVFPSGDYDG